VQPVPIPVPVPVQVQPVPVPVIAPVPVVHNIDQIVADAVAIQMQQFKKKIEAGLTIKMESFIQKLVRDNIQPELDSNRQDIVQINVQLEKNVLASVPTVGAKTETKSVEFIQITQPFQQIEEVSSNPLSLAQLATALQPEDLPVVSATPIVPQSVTTTELQDDIQIVSKKKPGRVKKTN
jgi:hypothetical protein